jgi:hypothetical protein
MNRCWMLLCLTIALGACQEGLDAPEALAETAQALACKVPPPQIANWQGQLPPVAGPTQSYHAIQSPQNANEMLLLLADPAQGKIVWAVRTKDAKEQQALLGKTWGRGPVDVVRPPPPPPPPIGDDFFVYVMARAAEIQKLHDRAMDAVQQCGP